MKRNFSDSLKYVLVQRLFKRCLVLLLFSQSILFSQNIDSIIRKLPSLSGKEKVLALDDLCYFTLSKNTDQSISFGNQALSLAKKLGDSLLIATCQNELSLSYLFKGNFDSCIILAESAYKIRLAKKQIRDAGASLAKVGTAYSEQGKYAVALDKLLKATELFQQVNAENEIAQIKNNIGIIYERNNQLQEAKRMYKESADAADKVKDHVAYVTAMGNYGIVIKKLGNLQKAQQIYESLIPICKQHCPPEYLSQIYQSLGVVARDKGNHEKGLEYYLKAREIYHQIGSLNGLSIININIGKCYVDLRKYDQAEQFLNLGLKQAEEIKSLQWRQNAYEGLYKLETVRGNHEKANEYLEYRMALHDSIYSDETRNKLVELQALFDLKQKENTILEQKNTIAEKELSLSRRNIVLVVVGSVLVILLLSVIVLVQVNNVRRKKAALAFQKTIQRERSRISKDLHDNMGAELTIISSAIDIKAYDSENIKDKKDLEAISDQVRKASALMRDTIWTVSEEKISVVQFGIKIKEFADRAFGPKNVKVHFKNSASDLNLRPESTLNLFRMVQEVINNAAKHAGAKNIYIENFVNDSRVITLWDDGTGFDLSTEERGYGLNNILSRAKDIQAKMDIISKQGEGTKVTIIIGDDSIWQ
ncbi:MAG: hypothetical protein K0S12_1136 [Bacteroidetes bacterium]|nr:hypothetical protein [Bacteroidota bacterium]